ncbi:acetyl-CoA hydrolase/transferase C-terminal domain-containing protein [Mycolicibacterium sp.]|uniref:acetyl-CoA hydrolase/transferase C-terminal domain-containing protein n=1 Tax=Mycolicibacterium sp. TaxID=2320850 RepID=UPI001A2D17C5|nr:acetyl-CoA hydrolase/transferase C-terminal domain-containing protein [Mycolicibacterium sp.]MBJ7336441.1 acetyl-CoA hydrolase [Mycolicibacterium sp.]
MTSSTTKPGLAAALREVLRPGMTVAIGDGAGTVRELEDGTNVCAELSAAAADIGSLRLVLGWAPGTLNGLDSASFAAIAALVPSGSVRSVLQNPLAHFVPSRLSAIPALLAGPLRPDVLITRLVKRDGQYRFGTEVSYQRALVDSGVPVLAVIDDAAPSASAEPALDPDRVRVIGRSNDGPAHMHREPEPLHDALADEVLRFVPAGARLQYGPGQLGTALLRRAAVPLRIDTGMLTDAVVDLERHGMLVGEPSATYLVGTDVLYHWADTRPILRGIEHTHDLTRLSRGEPFVAVNTAIEIDPVGQINVEGVGDKLVGGIGGHPDYCAAGAMSRGGLSIIAVPSSTNGRSPLVEQLSRPASTPAHDVDVIVTEAGHADLRGADWSQRRRMIHDLFS